MLRHFFTVLAQPPIHSTNSGFTRPMQRFSALGIMSRFGQMLVAAQRAVSIHMRTEFLYYRDRLRTKRSVRPNHCAVTHRAVKIELTLLLETEPSLPQNLL